MKNRIAEIIEKEKLTSLKFANLIGVVPAAVSHILSGRNNPSMDVVQKILNTFRTISSDWLILGVGSMYRETGETTKRQPVEVKFASNNPQMPSLFPNESENGTEYHKENASAATPHFRSSQNQSAPTVSERQVIINEENNKNPENKPSEMEPKTPLPKKVAKKMIIYYSDSTFQEYNMRLNTEE